MKEINIYGYSVSKIKWNQYKYLSLIAANICEGKFRFWSELIIRHGFEPTLCGEPKQVKSSLFHIHCCQKNSLYELNHRAMFCRHKHAKEPENKQTKQKHVHTHKQWKSITVYHSWTCLMSRLLFVTLMMLNMLDEVINTVQLSSLIMRKIGKKNKIK